MNAGCKKDVLSSASNVKGLSGTDFAKTIMDSSTTRARAGKSIAERRENDILG